MAKCDSGFNNGSKLNGFGNGSSSGSDSGSLRTYKRRKCGSGGGGCGGVSSSLNSDCKLVDLENGSSAHAISNDKMEKEVVDLGFQKSFCEPVCDLKVNCHPLLNGSDDGSYQHWRGILESICQSLRHTEGKSGGIQDSITDVLNCVHSSHAKLAKESIDHLDGQSDVHRTTMANGGSTVGEGVSAVTSNGSSNESDLPTVSRLCGQAFFKLLTSGKFVSLCKLLSENFHGLKIGKLLDFSLIDSRMKEGLYESKPMLFSSDIQQIWRRLISIGNEMVSLSNNLSELSRAFCHEMGGGTDADTSSDRKHEVSARDFTLRIKQEDLDASVFCTCRQCGERSDGRDCLVCDSCEAMFHVSCIEPAVKEIPHKSWYCTSCASVGVGSSHEDCTVCERLNATSGIHGVDTIPSYEETFDEFEESSDGIIETGPQVFKGSKQLPCKVCGNNLTDGEEFQICEHRFCQFKYYHIGCLSSKELKSYGPRWYCPSCLCRVCLADKDDDDIVMCDGCDHGYHIYCMTPPRMSIPKGKWFCPKCDAGIKAIRKVKKLYEDLERIHKRSEGEKFPDCLSKKAKLEFEDAVGGSGGMDMLLTAARTLNDEEVSDMVDGKS